jgi:hypothetical protein
LAVAGTTGGAVGFFLEGLLYRSTGSHWLAVPFIMFFFFPETAGLELETISSEEATSP